MKIVKIPIHYNKADNELDLIINSEIDSWCQDNGLVKNKDYKCYYMNGLKEYHVQFNTGHENVASMLLLRFING